METSATSRAPERDMFSEPARSTKFSLPHLISSSPSGVASLMCIVIENRECDRLKYQRTASFRTINISIKTGKDNRKLKKPRSMLL